MRSSLLRPTLESTRAERDIALVRLISPNTTLLISSSSHDADMQPAGIDPQNRAMLANEYDANAAPRALTEVRRWQWNILRGCLE